MPTALDGVGVEAFERDHRTVAAIGPDWVRTLRETGMQRFRDAGFPAEGEASWRFTSLKPLRKLELTFRPGDPAELSADRIPPAPRGWDRLTFVNGIFVRSLSSRAASDGVEVRSLAEALSQEGDRLRPLLGETLDMTRHRFAALNTAHLTDGAFVRIPAGTQVPEPIHLLFMALPGESPRALYPRVLIVMEDGAQARIVEEYVSPEEGAYFACPVTEVVVGKNAGLDHVRLEREGKRGIHLGSGAVSVKRDGRYTGHVISLGGQLTRFDLDLSLDGEGAEGVLNGLYLPAGKRHVDHHTRVEHVSAHTTSLEHYKGVLTGKATAVFNGRIVIRPGAQQSDAAQTNNNLLLSAEALVNTNPELEIFADDVKARHGATIGQLEDEHLFYLRSRGIDEASARRLLVYAFAGEMIERIPIPSLRDELASWVEAMA